MQTTIVVCTRNRSDLLAGLLTTFTHQTFNTSDYGILIVDNGSTDVTYNTVTKFQSSLPNLQYVYEPKVGLSHARNCGYLHAASRYVGFVDDDCRLPDRWVAVANEIASSIKPDVFGGPYYALFESDKPDWFKDEYGSRHHGDAARCLGAEEFLSGGNLFVRRDVLESIGGFRPEFGMNDKKFGVGEEVFFLRQLRRINENAIHYYDPRLFLYHIVRPEKMRLSSMALRYFASGRDCFRLATSTDHKNRFSILRKSFWTFRQFLKETTYGSAFRDSSKYPHFQNYMVERGLPWLWETGYYLEAFRLASAAKIKT